MGKHCTSKVNESEILNLHSKNHSVSEICELLNITEYFVSKTLKKNGLKGGTKIDRLKNKYPDIIESYKRNGKLSTVAKEFNVSENIVEKILDLHQIQKKTRHIVQLNVNDIVNYYEKTRRVKDVAQKFRVSNRTILKILHSNNVRVSVIPYTEEQIIEKYMELKTIDSTYKFLGISEGVVRQTLKKHNIELQFLKRYKIGDVFGKLTIIEEIGPKITNGGNKRRQFVLICECGEKVVRNSLKLSEGKSQHCGCVTQHRKKENEEKKRIKQEDLQRKLEIREEKKRNHIPKEKKSHRYVVGSVRGKLTILSITDDGDWKTRMVTVQCECGTIKETSMSNMYSIKSCGCLQTINRVKVSTKHGLAPKKDEYQRKWYDRWRSMIRRCHNPISKPYMNYGGRGIIVCDRWREPNGVGCKNYIDDIHNILGPQPSPEHSLDRINNDGPYEITNLRWATNSEQVKNQRRNIKK